MPPHLNSNTENSETSSTLSSVSNFRHEDTNIRDSVVLVTQNLSAIDDMVSDDDNVDGEIDFRSEIDDIDSDEKEDKKLYLNHTKDPESNASRSKEVNATGAEGPNPITKSNRDRIPKTLTFAFLAFIFLGLVSGIMYASFSFDLRSEECETSDMVINAAENRVTVARHAAATAESWASSLVLEASKAEKERAEALKKVLDAEKDRDMCEEKANSALLAAEKGIVDAMKRAIEAEKAKYIAEEKAAAAVIEAETADLLRKLAEKRVIAAGQARDRLGRSALEATLAAAKAEEEKDAADNSAKKAIRELNNLKDWTQQSQSELKIAKDELNAAKEWTQKVQNDRNYWHDKFHKR